MIPVGYMAKRISPAPEGLALPEVRDVYSVSDCVNDDFADYVNFYQHNSWWFFNSPDVIHSTSREHSIDLGDTHLFYYEVYELEYHKGHWRSFSPWNDIHVSHCQQKSTSLPYALWRARCCSDQELSLRTFASRRVVPAFCRTGHPFAASGCERAVAED
jgi:hypothetical protein